MYIYPSSWIRLSDYDHRIDHLWCICKIFKFIGMYAVCQYVNRLFIYNLFCCCCFFTQSWSNIPMPRNFLPSSGQKVKLHLSGGRTLFWLCFGSPSMSFKSPVTLAVSFIKFFALWHSGVKCTAEKIRGRLCPLFFPKHTQYVNVKFPFYDLTYCNAVSGLYIVCICDWKLLRASRQKKNNLGAPVQMTHSAYLCLRWESFKGFKRTCFCNWVM